MSYSRWSNSVWYTFWSCQDEETENRDTAIFEVCTLAIFQAKELRDQREGCLNKIKLLRPATTAAELDELSGYMDEFLLDVDEDYPADRPTH